MGRLSAIKVQLELKLNIPLKSHLLISLELKDLASTTFVMGLNPADGSMGDLMSAQPCMTTTVEIDIKFQI